MQQGWELWSADISEAFLRGLTFEELHERGGQLRDVQISLPPGEEFLLRAIEGYEDLDAATEILVLVKPGFGLRDAPHLWLLALKKVLTRTGVTACQGDQHGKASSGTSYKLSGWTIILEIISTSWMPCKRFDS